MSDYQPTPPPSSPWFPQPQVQRTNTLSIVALILGFVVPLGGIICGHIALSQIKRTGEQGHGLALAGTVLGYVFTAFGVLLLIGYIALFAGLAASGALSSAGS